jgi:hypothetical protein
MFSMMRGRVSFAGLIAIAALVFAVSGGAWAAGKYLITSTKQISPSVLKKLKGKTGATGPQGPVGPAGSNGKDGTNGATGANGVSVTSKEFEGEEGPCTEGGAEFKSASPEPTYACNGSPWPAGGTLPSNATETGAVSLAALGSGVFAGSVSFAIPLAAPLPETAVHAIKKEGTVPSACDNGEAPAPSPANPEADSGHLCVFLETAVEPFIFKTGALFVEPGAGRTGAQVALFGTEGTTGTWAVTAP